MAVGIAACLLLFLVIQFETSFDNFHQKKKIFIVYYLHFKHLPDWIILQEFHFPLQMLCVLIYPQIKEVAAIYGSRNEQITIPGKDKEPPKKFKEATGVFFSEPQFFHLFDFKLLAGDIKTALSDPNTGSHKRYIPLLQQVSDFGEAFRGAEVRYNEGVSTQVDYLIAKTNVDRARINLISAKYDYIFQTKILDYYQGKLIL